MKPKPKQARGPVIEEGPWYSLYNKHCTSQDDCFCRDCAWDRALAANIEKVKKEEKDA